jgi:hypothetical protein
MSEAFEAGASFFLYKPIDRESLLRLVRATQGAMENERRRTRRVPLQCRVQLRIDDQQIDGQTIDVGMEGVLVRVSRPIRLDRRSTSARNCLRARTPWSQPAAWCVS